MNKGIYPVLSGSIGYEKMLNVIANNIANVNTAGYKADRAVFKVDTLVSDVPSAGIVGESKSFTELGGVYTDFSPGVIKQTGNRLDIAIEGEGFFVIDTPEGQRYTRSGNFIVNDANILATQDGYPVMGEGGPIIIEGGEIFVDAEGRVSVNGEEVNKLRIVDFSRPYSLTKIGESMFSGDNEVEATGYRVIQGALEMSNVNQLKEMSSMIEILRGYESYRKVIMTMDETSARTNELGRV